MLHPDVVLRHINDEIGYGVFTTKPIPAGTITWVQDPLDRVLDPHLLKCIPTHFAEIVQKYTWLNRDGNRVLCWDFARYMNHSCAANCLSPGLDFEIAIRDIEAGEQLTTDYGALNLEDALHCACGSIACRGLIKNEDFDTYAAHWDQSLGAAFPRIPEVPQPLWPCVTEKQAILDALADPAAIRSIITHRFPVQVANGIAR